MARQAQHPPPGWILFLKRRLQRLADLVSLGTMPAPHKVFGLVEDRCERRSARSLQDVYPALLTAGPNDASAKSILKQGLDDFGESSFGFRHEKLELLV